MHFGTIGAGTIGQALAAHIVKAGHDVTLSNSRGPESLSDVVAGLGPHASAGTVAQAARADIVFLAVQWPQIRDALANLPDWSGRILVDASNPMQLVDGKPELMHYDNPTSSEIVAQLAPGARVVKAFNSLYAQYISPDPRHPAGRQVVFFAGDDASAKTTFATAIDEFGFAAVDVGPLAAGGRLMAAGHGPLAPLHVLKQD